LQGNVCIDENFTFTKPTQIAKFRQKITDKCEFERNRGSTEKSRHLTTTETTLRTSVKTNEVPTTAATVPNLLTTAKTVAIIISAIFVILACTITCYCCFMKYCGRKNQTSPLTNVVKVRLLPDGTMQVIGSPTNQTIRSLSTMSGSLVSEPSTMRMSSRSLRVNGTTKSQSSLSPLSLSQTSSNLTLKTQTPTNQTPKRASSTPQEPTMSTPQNAETPLFGSPISGRSITQSQMSLVNFVFGVRETLTSKSDASKAQASNDSNINE
jgi:hypothetical protein